MRVAGDFVRGEPEELFEQRCLVQHVAAAVGNVAGDECRFGLGIGSDGGDSQHVAIRAADKQARPRGSQARKISETAHIRGLADRAAGFAGQRVLFDQAAGNRATRCWNWLKVSRVSWLPRV